MTPGCDAHLGVEFFELWDRNRIQKYFSLFIRGPRWVRIMKKLEVENLGTHSFISKRSQLGPPNPGSRDMSHLFPHQVMQQNITNSIENQTFIYKLH